MSSRHKPTKGQTMKNQKKKKGELKWTEKLTDRFRKSFQSICSAKTFTTVLQFYLFMYWQTICPLYFYLFIFAVLIENYALQIYRCGHLKFNSYLMLAVLLLCSTGIIFLLWDSNCALVSPSFQPWQGLIWQPMILQIWVLCNRNIHTRIVSLSCGIGVGQAASALVSSARLQELREIQDATVRMITSFSRQSKFDSIWAEFGSQTITASKVICSFELQNNKTWQWICVGYSTCLETSGRCECSICFHCKTYKTFKHTDK